MIFDHPGLKTIFQMPRISEIYSDGAFSAAEMMETQSCPMESLATSTDLIPDSQEPGVLFEIFLVAVGAMVLVIAISGAIICCCKIHTVVDESAPSFHESLAGRLPESVVQSLIPDPGPLNQPGQCDQDRPMTAP
jgi:hypothetical protein